MRRANDAFLAKLESTTLALLRRTPDVEKAFPGNVGLLESAGLDVSAVERMVADVRARRAPDAAEFLEAIVRPRLRPVIDVVGGMFECAGPLFAELRENPAPVLRALPSVGRVEIDGVPGLPYAGTGFLVGPGLLMTNRHVAELFVLGLGTKVHLRFVTGVRAQVDLRRERDSKESRLLEVVGPVLVHPYWDLALLEVRGLEGLAPLRLASQPPPGEAPAVAAIGYPAFDRRNDRDVQRQVFGDVYGVKRVQPGYGMGPRPVRSYGRDVEAFAHDCSTLGGNSGSCLVDVTTGDVLGLHFAGAYLDANFAVPAWELACDHRVVDAGVQFSDGAPAPGPTVADQAWDVVERPVGPRAASESPLAWFERADDAELIRAWREDPARCAERLQEAVGPADAQTILRRLSEGNAEGTVEGLYPPPDPDAPEILFLHGILGAHLDSAHGRVWLDLPRLLAGDLAGALALQPDGVRDARGGPPIGPGPHLRLKYQRAAAAWRDQGLVVHAFSFDWRRSVLDEAERLHHFVSTLRVHRPDRRFLVVGHSMGGLVAAAWTARHPEHLGTVTGAVLLGAPIHGSFSPIEVAHGTYPFVRKIGLLRGEEWAGEMAAAARTLPGLVDMLPDPEMFPDAAPLYEGQGWRGPPPSEARLRASLELKRVLATSPLLEKAISLVSADHLTVGTLTEARDDAPASRGDGTVPLPSAMAGMRAFRVTAEHADLPRDPQVIAAVLRVARGKAPALAGLDLSVARLALDRKLREDLDQLDLERARDVQGRARAGALDASDVDWLLSSGSAPSGRDAEGIPFPRRSGDRFDSNSSWVERGTGEPPVEALGPEFALQGPLGFGDPVHETITQHALRMTGVQLGAWKEIVRGVAWNDDPQGFLFDDATADPLDKSTGFRFGIEFKRWELISHRRPIGPEDGLLGRSHFGDLQWLHAMASSSGEAPTATRDAIVDWVRFCWEMVTDAIDPASPPTAWGHAGDRLAGAATPLSAMALFRAPTPGVARLRALGSALHLIQDSYSHGHVDREIAGSGRRGRVRRFLDYTEQDHRWHASFDVWRGGKTDEERIANLPGGTDALARSVEFLQKLAAKERWSFVETWLRNEILALDNKAETNTPTHEFPQPKTARAAGSSIP